MLKNDFNHKLAEEFLLSLENILKSKEDFTKNIDELYKQYLGFDCETLYSLPMSELDTLLVHNRLKDYSKTCILGILFIQEWYINNSGDIESFNKLVKGFSILKDVYLEDKETLLKSYKDYLLKASNTLMDYEISTDLKKDLVQVFFKDTDFEQVDELIFEILDEDSSYKPMALDLYNKMLLIDDETLKSKNITKDEIEDAKASINNI